MRVTAPSTFEGTIQATRRDEGWEGQFSGALRNLSFKQLMAGRSLHRLSGLGDLTIRDTATFSHGRIEWLAGELVIGPGTIGQPLLDSATWLLGLRSVVGAERDKRDEDVPFGRLACTFRLRRGEFAWSPIEQAGVVVLHDNNGQPLYGLQGPQEDISIGTLLQVLTPSVSSAAETQAPANRQSSRLMGYLPLGETADSAVRPRSDL